MTTLLWLIAYNIIYYLIGRVIAKRAILNNGRTLYDEAPFLGTMMWPIVVGKFLWCVVRGRTYMEDGYLNVRKDEDV